MNGIKRSYTWLMGCGWLLNDGSDTTSGPRFLVNGEDNRRTAMLVLLSRLFP